MNNETWAINAAYAFMAKKHNGTPLPESYKLARHSVDTMNSNCKRLFGVTMAELYKQLRKGTAKARDHFEVKEWVKLTPQGNAWLSQIVSKHASFPIRLSDAYGAIDSHGRAVLNITSKESHVTGSRNVYCNLPESDPPAYEPTDHRQDEVVACLNERNLVKVLKILECVRD